MLRDLFNSRSHWILKCDGRSDREQIGGLFLCTNMNEDLEMNCFFDIGRVLQIGLKSLPRRSLLDSIILRYVVPPKNTPKLAKAMQRTCTRRFALTLRKRPSLAI